MSLLTSLLTKEQDYTCDYIMKLRMSKAISVLNRAANEGDSIIEDSNLSELDKAFLTFALQELYLSCFDKTDIHRLSKDFNIDNVRNVKRFVDSMRTDINKALKEMEEKEYY